MKNFLFAAFIFCAFGISAQLDTLGLHKRVQDFGRQLFKSVKMNSEYDLAILSGTKNNLFDIIYSKTNSHDGDVPEIEPTDEELEAEMIEHHANLNACLAKTFADMRALSIRGRDIQLVDIVAEDVLAEEITEENAREYDIGIYRIVVRIEYAGKEYALIANDCWNLAGGLIMGHNFVFDPDFISSVEK